MIRVEMVSETRQYLRNRLSLFILVVSVNDKRMVYHVL